MLRVFAIAFAVALNGAAAASDRTIVPGERIGSFALSMTVEDLVRENGPMVARGGPEGGPQVLSAALGFRDQVRDFWLHRWDDRWVRSTSLDRTGEIWSINVYGQGSDWRTREGLGLGGRLQDWTAVLGRAGAITYPTGQDAHHIWDNRGIAVRVRDDVVQNIIVFRPGTGGVRWRMQ